MTKPDRALNPTAVLLRFAAAREFGCEQPTTQVMRPNTAFLHGGAR